MAAYRGARIHTPALFIGGDRDPVIVMMRSALDGLPRAVPGLRKLLVLPGCGHWIQQERAAEVNAELLGFLESLDG
jgi:pimeloyl-ACP methyl ester carboxylesterase